MPQTPTLTNQVRLDVFLWPLQIDPSNVCRPISPSLTSSLLWLKATLSRSGWVRMFPVWQTLQDNRDFRPAGTFCPRGHPIMSENTHGHNSIKGSVYERGGYINSEAEGERRQRDCKKKEKLLFVSQLFLCSILPRSFSSPTRTPRKVQRRWGRARSERSANCQSIDSVLFYRCESRQFGK